MKKLPRRQLKVTAGELEMLRLVAYAAFFQMLFRLKQFIDMKYICS